jgi:hypothetical protein
MKPSFLRSVGLGIAAALMVVTAASSAAAQGLSSFSAAVPIDESLFFVGSDQHVHLGLGGNPASNQDLTFGSTPPGVMVFPYSSLSSFSDQEGWHVFYVGMDQHVHQLFCPNGGSGCTAGGVLGWADQDLTHLGIGSVNPGWWSFQLTSFNDVAGEHVYYIGTDNDVHQLYYLTGWTPYGPAGSAWGDQNLTKLSAPSSKPACGGLASFSNLTAGSTPPTVGEYTYYISCYDGHVHQLHANWSTVVDQDLLVTIGSAALTGFIDATGQYVYYISGDRHVHELSWNGTSLYNTDVTNAAPGGLPVDVYGQLTSFSDVNGRHVYYAGQDYDVHQLSQIQTKICFRFSCFTLWRWSDQDLTSSTYSAVKVDPCFARFSSLSDVGGEQEHVYYTGNDGHVHALTWDSLGFELDTILAANGVGPLWGCQPQ